MDFKKLKALLNEMPRLSDQLITLHLCWEYIALEFPWGFIYLNDEGEYEVQIDSN